MSDTILSIAESDSFGAAGIQGDVKTALALGGFTVTAVSALTAQDSGGHRSVAAVDPAFLAEQIRACLEDAAVGAIKIGFLPSAAAVDAVGDILDGLSDAVPVIVDPSIVSRAGALLVDEAAIAAWKRRLYVHAAFLTPNLREAQALGTMTIRDRQDMLGAADAMRTLGAGSVVLKAGAHEPGTELYVVSSAAGSHAYTLPTVAGKAALGAGSAFSTALALFVARGAAEADAIERALDFLHRAIAASPDSGAPAAGPINHAFGVMPDLTPFDPAEIRACRG